MQPNEVDKVVSYTVGHDGIIQDTVKELRDAEKEGYRVVNVLSTPTVAGTSGYVVVTVVLTKSGSGTYRGSEKQ